MTAHTPDTDSAAPTSEPTRAFESLAVHTGIPRAGGVGLGVPVHHSVAFQFESLEHGADVFATNDEYSYARLQSPTVEALETRLAALEGATSALAVSSGQAATTTAILSVCRAGDHVVATSSLFGGTSGLLRNVLPNFGITATIVDNDPEAVRGALRPETRLVWAETIGNPAADVADIPALALVAHAHGALLGVDNTWGGVGYLCRPLALGADIVTHSLTKWAAGQGAALAGAVLVGDRHDLSANPIFASGEPSLLETRGAGALSWRQRWLGAHQIGMTLGPQAAHLVVLGLETLALRLRQSCDNALALAEWLSSQPGVLSVNYPGLPDSPWFPLARRVLTHGSGAVLTFEVEDPARVLSRLELVRIAPSLGDTRTMVIHPWTTTHGRLPEEQRAASGVTPRLLRLSVGVEDAGDLRRDLAHALA
ncbi:PLP-dependent transferase [Deinococcus pimensis]|uniref:PLP-dependent transferase n=1 Tax=Deinococcus pimensis TaxID=309888 RepID=UPI000481737A|nr:PLP-dependent transferase [Deinococcus pimensis]